jgi:hypothetical protein
MAMPYHGQGRGFRPLPPHKIPPGQISGGMHTQDVVGLNKLLGILVVLKISESPQTRIE